MADWTAEEDSRLKKALAAGMSTSQAAGEVGNGKTRNAVIGRATRLGLQMRPRNEPSRKPRVAKKVRHPSNDRAGFFRASARPVAPSISEAIAHAEYQSDAADAPETGIVRMIDVLGRNGRCKFPLPGEDGLQAIVCGAGADADNPYCAHHHKISRTPTRARAG